MATIIPFTNDAMRRKAFIFRVRLIKTGDEENNIRQYPCIALYDREQGIPVFYPKLERWLFDMRKDEMKKLQTLRKKAIHLCSFLNYVLWETSIGSIPEISVNVLREFMRSYTKSQNGKDRDPGEWARGIADVFLFLKAFYEQNKEKYTFSYSPNDLFTNEYIKQKGKWKAKVVSQINKLSVTPPRKKGKKYRLLLYDHLEMLLYEARKHDPMLTLAIMLQAYAGLREGEIVNLTRSSLKRVYAGYGRIGKIVINLLEEARFSREYKGKTEFGAIKIKRDQEVYPDFLEPVLREMDEHDRLLQAMGASDEPEAPLFVNKQGRPMSVHVYCERLKKLFMNHFLPDIKKLTLAQGMWAENWPYIEAYERSYPGAHMLRHWFTMYLFQIANLKAEEVSKWRGDSDPTSVSDYLHIHADFLKVFTECIFTFQESVLEEIR